MIQAYLPIPHFHTFSPIQQCPPYTSHDHYHSSTFAPTMTPRPNLPHHLTPGSPQSNTTWLPALDKTRPIAYASSISINQGKGILWHSYYYWPHKRTEPTHTTMQLGIALPEQTGDNRGGLFEENKWFCPLLNSADLHTGGCRLIWTCLIQNTFYSKSLTNPSPISAMLICMLNSR